MAVDAHHLLLSPPPLFSNRDLTMNTSMELNNGGFCTNNQSGYGVVSQFSVAADDMPHLHLYGSSVDTTPIPTTADSFTYYCGGINNDVNVNSDFFPLPTRKRPRDHHSRSSNHHLLLQNPRSSSSASPSSSCVTTPLSFLGQDIILSSHINQEQMEIDRLISLHMERVKFEIEEKRKKQIRTILEAIEQGVVKRLRIKEEERDRIGKINNALEERLKSLSDENQVWRDLAQTNEATVNALRTNLEQVLAQVKDLRNNIPGARLDYYNNNNNAVDDDAQSCCGSTSSSGKGEEEEEAMMAVRRTIKNEAHDRNRMCRNCGKEESSVLIIPCRHLCLCGICGSTVHTCPICSSPKNASVHVNMSS